MTEEKSEGTGAARKLTIGAGAALGSTLLLAPAAEGANFAVTNTGDSGPGSLRQAVADADGSAGADTITFGSGVSGAITLTSGEIGINDANLDIQGPGAQTLAVDGGGNSQIFTIQGSGAANTTIISGLTLRNGNSATGGGAIGMDNGSGGTLTLRDAALTGNTASDDGGALYTGDGTVNAYNTTFSDNTAGDDGGAVWIDANDYQQTFKNVTISGNSAADDGGGIIFYSLYNAALIEDSTITGNSAGSQGGGAYFYTATAVYTPSGTPGIVVRNTTIADNTATDGAGVYFTQGRQDNFERAIEIENTTVTGNDATGTGGGVYLPDVDPTAQPEGTVSIDSSTVAGNTAATGGGLFRTAPVEELKNSIVADNTNGDLAEAPAAPGDFPLAFDLIEDPGMATTTTVTPGSNLTGIDPKLGPLAANGGPTQTLLPQTGSPAIDAGSSALTKDQRGLTRPVDLPDVPNSTAAGANGADIGAVEIQLPVAPPDTSVLDPVVEAKKPQEIGNQIKVKLKAGAGEDVSLNVFGRIKSKRGFPIKKINTSVPSGQLASVKVKPRDKAGTEKIQRSLAAGKKVKALLTVRLKDAAGNSYEKKLSIKLKPKK